MTVVLVALSPVQSPIGRNAAALRPMHISPVSVTRQVFGRRWRSAWCVSYYESRHRLAARNGANLGPWQVNVTAHPWVDPWRLTHSWWYSARVAYRISDGGRDWSAWTTHSLCGLR